MPNQTNPTALIPEVLVAEPHLDQQFQAIDRHLEIVTNGIMDPEQRKAFLRSDLREILQEIVETTPNALDRVKTIRTKQKMYITFAPLQIEIDLK